MAAFVWTRRMIHENGFGFDGGAAFLDAAKNQDIAAYSLPSISATGQVASYRGGFYSTMSSSAEVPFFACASIHVAHLAWQIFRANENHSSHKCFSPGNHRQSQGASILENVGAVSIFADMHGIGALSMFCVNSVGALSGSFLELLSRLPASLIIAPGDLKFEALYFLISSA